MRKCFQIEEGVFETMDLSATPKENFSYHWKLDVLMAENSFYGPSKVKKTLDDSYEKT